MFRDNFTAKVVCMLVLFLITSSISVKVGTLASSYADASGGENIAPLSGSQPTALRLSWTLDATDTTITIMWETGGSGNRNEAMYGTTMDCDLGPVTGFSYSDSWGVNYNHQVELTGLIPNTKYYYKVSGDGVDEWSDVHTFNTAPDTSINWSFFVGADSQSIDDFHSVINAVRAFPEGRMYFAAGDILGNYDSQTDWRQWTDASEGLISNVSYISCTGNHEYNTDGMGEREYNYFYNCFAFPPNEHWFSYNYSNSHFIVLDTQNEDDPSQIAWLEKDLQAAASDPAHPWIFVIFHKPVYADGGHQSDINARESFAPLFRDYGVDMVFSGHNHFYQRTYPLNLTNINNPTVSYWSKDEYYYPEPIFVTAGRADATAREPTNENGWMVEDRMSMEVRYMKVDVYTNMSIRVTARYIDNTIFDEFWIVKTGEAPPRPPAPPPPPPTQDVILLPRSDNWLYSETDPQPVTSPSWNESGYDDSGWSSGLAPFGYGDVIEEPEEQYNTVLNDNDGSYYFRKTFDLDPSTELVSAKVYVASDNYAKVYLNGILISDDTDANHDYYYWNKIDNIPPDTFQTGTNTISVFVYNSAGSSDTYMNLELVGKILVENLVLIPEDDTWLYSETDPQPVTSPNWNESGYDDSEWSSGPAPLGFGDSTTYGTVLNDNDGSYYFRKTFDVDSVDDYHSLTLYVASDDYAIVYLNGVLVDDDTGANHEFEYWNRVVDLPVDSLQEGTNTIAVFVFNGGGSSDAYFNLKLKADVIANQGPTLSLHPGWNLISIPYVQSIADVDTVFSSISGSYDAVQIYDATDTLDPWKHYHTDKPAHMNDLHEVQNINGVWIHITGSDDVLYHVPGTMPTEDQSISLSPGWNLVGYPRRSSANRTTGLNNTLFGTHVDKIMWHNATSGGWHEMGENDEFVSGRGYWVHALTSHEWKLEFDYTPAIRLSIPAYFSHGAIWDRAVSDAPATAIMIMNPSNGPGTSSDPDYVDAVANAQAEGIKVLGYVYTLYTSRDINEVKSEIDDYMIWYGVDGIFLDEVSNDGADLEYYQDLANYIRSKSGSFIMINPGTVPDELYMGVSDVVIVFENTYTEYTTRTFPAWMNGYPRTRFKHLVYDTPEADFQNAWSRAMGHNVGYVYITDDAAPNPWDTLPEYWNSEVYASDSS